MAVGGIHMGRKRESRKLDTEKTSMLQVMGKGRVRGVC